MQKKKKIAPLLLRALRSPKVATLKLVGIMLFMNVGLYFAKTYCAVEGGNLLNAKAK